MKKQQIQDLFNQRYNQATWKQFLGQAFANVQLLSTPENLTVIDHHVAANAQKLGYISLDEDGIERQIAVYEVTLADGIILERNRVGLRNLLRKYWKNIDAAFIVYHHPESVNWRFTYVSELTGYDAEGEFIQIKTEPKRYTYILGEGESIRTAVERFERIINKGNKVSLDDVKEAFSVEKLSKTFFDEYKKHYDGFCKYMVSQPGISKTVFNGDEKAIRDFSKKLLGRIVFLYFIQKKGWLGVPENEDWGTGDHYFLTNQFASFTHKELFYPDFLSVLFFDTLNTKRPDDLFIKNQSCKIPYLNGGLFEEDNPKYRSLIFDAGLFANLFNFFDQYNFTIYEDDPLDHTIAVDPEMLGHIFENLLEDNKDKGAYYTPKEIVHYMCQESLIEYLNTYCLNYDFSDLGITLIEETQKELITQFIKKKEINLDILEKSSKSKESYKSWFRHLNIALDKVKICDPAIGSGAFPMGLLHEIFTAKQTLHTFEFGNTTNFNASEVKLNVIQNSIYGVDIERGAVDIARLRFWLSLIVDEDKPKALPNLDYKIVVGNSLVSKFGDDIIDIDWEMKDVTQGSILVDVYQPQEILRKISAKQKEFFSPDSDKKTLAADIRDLKIDLLISQLELMIKSKGMETKPTGTGKTLTKQTEIHLQTVGWKQNIKELRQLKNNPDKSLNFFDWKLDFPEVMNQQLVENVGFDIVIANPPYDVYQGKKKSEIEGLLKFEIYHKCKGGKINAYELFLAKTDFLLKVNGTNCQIFQNSYLADNSSKGVRDYYFKNQHILFIDSFPERDDPKKRLFESVKMSVCILMSKKRLLEDYSFILKVHANRTLKNYYYVEFNKKEIYDFDPINAVIPNLKKEDKNIFLKYYKSTSNFCYSELFECIEGELNMTFHKSYMTNNIQNPLIVKGAQIQRYFITNKPSQGIIEFVDKASFIKDYPNSKKTYHHRLQRIAFQGISGANDKIRIISTLINKDIYCANSCNYIISKEDNQTISIIAMLGVFNSKLTNWIFRKTSTNSNVNCYEINNLRLPIILKKKSKNVEDIVHNILTLKSQGKDTTALEQQIDNMVYKLYELTYKEVKIIDPEFPLTEQEYADIKI
ncbi:Eco57I restriction-modification methylase domain-containing protein [Dolichospermum sp. UHCC 0684]|uniref:Eco57I restriction-modification methylase domain-containing protein n=1 Tax=unclassified Dolichospermum TaxID=2622029 RepID=UPI0014472731|nr:MULTISPECIES: Eco57I restriction-modification methylase domain-containing protein [unclassified Dolichospermum]MEA5531819.1 Eco57I restriction-modification methylase domain-containing protein [Dolichospermum sp. UHCC 0684]MTJ35659.1 hypothetical protein [Dolichospermum sp. UHCC 0260]